MKQILGTLSLGPVEALFGLLLAFLWAWHITGRDGAPSKLHRFKASLSGLFSLGFFTLWDGEKKPDVLNPAILSALCLYLLITGTEFEIPVFAYGFCLTIGFIAAIALAAARAKQLNVNEQHILDLGMLAVGFGVFGARLFYYVEHYSSKFADRPLWDFFAVWEGGIVYYGGLIFASLACLVYLRLRGYRIFLIGDIVAPSLGLGLSFGRLGCFFNGCCWGSVCEPSVPLATQFPRQSFAWWRHVENHTPISELQAFQDGQQGIEAVLAHVPPELHDWSLFVYPSQLYSWIGAIAVTVLILIYEKWIPRKEGQSFALFFVLYAPTRFVLELFRGDSELTPSLQEGVFTSAQTVSLVLFFGALGAWLLLHWKGRVVSTIDLAEDLNVVD